MSKVLNIAAGLAALPMLAVSATAFADSPGDLAGGSDIYQVRNVTTNGNYGSTISAACNDTIKYSVKLSNTDYGQLTDVTVKASLTSGSMTATAKAANGANTTTTGAVSVSLPTNGSLSYVSGTTKLYDVNGNLLKDLSDGVTAGGVNAGTLNGSTREFLQFQAKLNCETPPKQITVCELATKKVVTITEDKYDTNKYSKDLSKCVETPPTPGQITVCDLNTKKVVNIKETEFDSTKYSKDLSKCVVTTTPPVTPPTTLVNTGAGDIVAVFAGVSAVAAAAYAWVMRRQNAR